MRGGSGGGGVAASWCLADFFPADAGAVAGAGGGGGGGAGVALLSGPSRSGRTSLLWGAALSTARRGDRAWVLCERARAEAGPPVLTDALRADAAWQDVHVRYVASDAELRQLLCCLHVLPRDEWPDALLVDDFGALCGPAAASRDFSRTLALLADIASQLGVRVLLVDAAAQGGPAPANLFLYQRWCSAVFTLSPGAEDSTSVTWALTAAPAAGAPPHPNHGLCAEFCLADDTMQLERVRQFAVPA